MNFAKRLRRLPLDELENMVAHPASAWLDARDCNYWAKDGKG